MDDNGLLSPSQKCANSKRDIFEAVYSIKDRIVELNCKNKSGKLISFDLDHAFDRVDHGFLLVVMRSMCINPSFVSLLGKIMSTSCSRLLINGNLTPEFPILQSVRQGDPLSMHLFVLYLHPLLEKLSTICNNPMELVVAYADDISVIIIDDTKLDRIKQAFLDFRACSGAVLNLGKTVAVNIGRQRGQRQPAWPIFKESVKILGVTYFNSLKETINFNWGEVIRKTSHLMWLFKARNLTLHQKVIALNTYVTSRLWYLGSVMSMPNSAIARITSQIGYFLWGRFPTRVPMEQLTLPRKYGGLNLHLPMHKCKSLLVNRFCRSLEHTPFAHELSIHMANPPNITAIPAAYPCLKYIGKIVPYIPEQITRNPSSGALHDFYRMNLKKPKIVAEHPSVTWERVWSNINSNNLTSAERSTFFLLVNRKIPHAHLMHRTNRQDSPMCQFCPNVPEDLDHKFSSCVRVRDLWFYLRLKLETILGKRVGIADF